MGRRWQVANLTNLLGFIACDQGDLDAAAGYFRRALPITQEIRAISMTLDVLCGVALLKLLQGDLIQAAELLGLALAHPLASADVKNTAEPILDALRAHPSADTVIIEAARARGAALNVDTTVAAFLAETAAD